MSPFGKMAIPVLGGLAAVLSFHPVWGEASPPPFIGEEIQRAQSDFASGGARKLSTNWYACVDRAQVSQNANAAERCVVYGYSALLLTDPGVSDGGRHLTSDILAPGQVEMLQIMGIPAGPQQAWLERYRRWVSQSYRPERSFASGSGFTSDGAATADRGSASDGVYTPGRGTPDRGGSGGNPFRGHARDGDDMADSDVAPPSRHGPAGADGPFRGHSAEAFDDAATPFRAFGPNRGDGSGRGFTQVSSVIPARGFTPSLGDSGDGGSRGATMGLATAANGHYPKEVLRQPEIADALRNLVGPSVFARLKDYTFGDPIQINGRFAAGVACMPRDCGGSEARFVFSQDEVWVGIIGDGRMRIYGNPPRKVRALLLKDRNQVAWRGAVDDMSRSGSAPVVPASLEVAPRGQEAPPRMEIAPRMEATPRPEAGPHSQPTGDATEIRLRRKGGTFDVPVTINDTMTLPFAIDSGSSDVSVSADVLQKLMQSGTVSRADFLGKQTYHLADGSRVSSDTFRIHSLKVGDREVRDVIGSVTNDAESLLLGQSFLERFRSWSIDNQRGVLLLR